MNYLELNTELATFKEQFQPKLNTEINRVQNDVNELALAVNKDGIKAAYLSIIKQAKPSTTASQVLLTQYLTGFKQILSADRAHVMITATAINSFIDTLGKRIHRNHGQAVYDKTLVAIHAACCGKLDAGYIAGSLELFDHVEVEVDVLKAFALALNNKETAKVIESIEQNELELVNKQNELEQLKELSL